VWRCVAADALVCPISQKKESADGGVSVYSCGYTGSSVITPFQRLQWLFPIALAVHNGEEAITMPEWVARHASEVPSRVAVIIGSSAVHALPPIHTPSANTIRLALLVLTLIAFFVTWFSVRSGKQSVWAYLVFGGIVTMLANVFVPHVPGSVLFQAYTPGVVTAVLINLPLMSWLALRAVREGWVSGAKAWMFGALVPLAVAGLVAGLLIT
jgi:hypothetical protein